jgi:hypothetical protein
MRAIMVLIDRLWVWSLRSAFFLILGLFHLVVLNSIQKQSLCLNTARIALVKKIDIKPT